MSDSFTIAKTANTRVFLIEGGARADHAPSYESCLRMMGIAQGFGDIERIECPDPQNYGKFVEVGSIRGANERPTTSLEGRYALDLQSDLLRLARQGCAFDVQLHMGACQNPASFNEFDKILILEGAYPTNYSTEDLGALQSGDNAAINETTDISASDVYEALPLAYVSRAGSILTNEVIDVVVCDNVSCGDCEDESSGCEKIFAVTLCEGGSPGTSPDIVYSIDGGANWYAHDIEELTSAQSPTGIECLGDYIVVISNDAGSLCYALKSEFDTISDPEFEEITTGIVAGGEPNGIWSTGSYAFIVGDNGYVYGCEDPADGVTVLDAGAATGNDLLAVHGLSSTFAVAVGINGTVLYTSDGSSWGATTTNPAGIGVTLYTVWVVSENVWWVGASNGYLYYTLNAGETWNTKAFAGAGTGIVYDIVFATPSVGRMAHQTGATAGRIFTTFDGGYSWKLAPEKSGTLPANDKINKLAYCSGNANFICGVGLADDASDGFIVVGSIS